MTILVYRHFSEVPPAEWYWRDFSPRELACQHCGMLKAEPYALDRLQAVRVLYGRPIRVISFHRCKHHPIEAAKIADGRSPGAHEHGTAIDPGIYEGGNLAELVDAFFKVGVLGRGMGLKNGVLHLHFDWDRALGKRIWGY